MYYRKIWHETGGRFFALLIVGLCFGWLLMWARTSSDLSRPGFALGQALPPALATRIWLRGTMGVMGSGGLMLYLIGLVVGCSGIGEEIEHGTATFLLTRPRSRGYFVWSFWLASVLELLAFTSILMLSGYVTLSYLIHHAGPRNFLLILPVLMITGLLGVGLAQFLLTVSRSSKYALAGGLVLSISYLTAATVLKIYEVIKLPTPMNMYSLDLNANAVAMVVWLTTAVGFIGLTHLIATRVEV
jgi:ABC-type transport system involved in multi-copper enzyme maturation permease subunit